MNANTILHERQPNDHYRPIISYNTCTIYNKSSIKRMFRIGLFLIFPAILSNAWTLVDTISRSSRSRQFVPPTQQVPTPTTTGSTQLFVRVGDEVDLDVLFGRDILEEAGSDSWGEADEDAESRQKRKARVGELLAAADAEYRRGRKERKWGSFANVTKKEDLDAILQKERARIEYNNNLTAKAAQSGGLLYQVLEPKSNIAPSYDDGEVQINFGTKKSWFESMDSDLAEEWKALTGSDKDSDEMDVAVSDGKIVARDAMSGVRVGSLGGWTLEVFPGDFVVHRKYGIGRFEKTCLRPKTKLTIEEQEARDERRAEILTTELRKLKNGVTAEQIQNIRSKFGTEEDKDPISNPQTAVLEITYEDVVVHVPVERAYRLSRYRAGESAIKPKLSRVKGDAWTRAKRGVEEKTLQIAQDVLALYATREILRRPPFDPALEVKVLEFEKTFKFEPTPDQLKCFEDAENDMVWRSRPMDRLVCGDVGFGKTEVAFRALYRAVANGKQGALLAPTGVLAAQHFKNIVGRMGPDTPFGVNICLLRGNNNRKTKAGVAMRAQIKSGEFQIVVGTHALLANDIKFKDLGLLVIDEEQRFGVKQKERLKLICSGVDVLTLSATPIPRTLQMSLSGIRDTSTIKSPPPMRKATITYVKDFSEEAVYEAISTELARGGQCYYVLPRIQMLDEAEEVITRLFPEIRIIQAHGRMKRNGAEENVAEFAEGKYDVLLATTVIENGVDIPTVNTIIVQNSQAFGISTLYQLRGRVGRSDKQAYAYFLHREESVTEQAALRLQAIGELHELGSGFDVANRDLEIRGAGSLLGTEQSGMAAKVGFDLYMRMLKKSIRQLRGLDLPLVPRTNILMSTAISPDSFYIPHSFIPDQSIRYQEASRARLAESTAQLVNITNEWKAKYGPIPADLQNQLKAMHLYACSRRLGIDLIGLVRCGDRIDCVLRSPGLRPRHWATIVQSLPQGVAPKSMDVCFPARFTESRKDTQVRGGQKEDLKQLLADKTLSEDREDEEWDAIDEEEVEAMKSIASAVNVKEMSEVDVEQYPRFVLSDFGSSEKSIDRLLKFLLPIAKVVYDEQEKQGSEARAAAELREKHELIRARTKQLNADEAKRLGYYDVESDQ
jgi:RecG-like helicase